MSNPLTKLNDSELQKALANPFNDGQISWKPEITKKTDKQTRQKVDIFRNGVQVAGCTAHIDARDVMNRLDDVVGFNNWSDSYQVLNGGKNVECTLTIKGVSKTDVGQVPKEGGFADPLKSAYSDALKRAAVKFGIGRHLYAMEMQWLPFDGYRITSKPVTKKADDSDNPFNRNNLVNPDPPQEMKEQQLSEKVMTVENAPANGVKLMSPVKYVNHCQTALGYESPQHVRATMKLLGFKTVPNDRDKRRAIYAALMAYREYRNGGKSQDDALAAIDNQTSDDTEANDG